MTPTLDITGHHEPTQKRVRGVRDAVTMIDSEDVLLVWEWAHYPRYHFPRRDVAPALLAEARRPDPRFPDHVSFDWDVLDHWYEEDEEVFVHPRDPYSRIDFLPSGRRVEVLIGGMVVADSTDVVFLHETRLPRRAYLAPDDVRLDLARPSALHTRCPYKGIASYWSIEVDGALHADIAWYYPDPIWQAEPIRDRICFFDELVDVRVDGVEQQRPRTHFTSEPDPQPSAPATSDPT